MKIKIPRREFLKIAARTGAALAFPAALGAGCGKAPENNSRITAGNKRPHASPGLKHAPKVLLISIDSMPPHYLTLNAEATGPGKNGDWLMPNVKRFVNQGVLFDHARCFLPSATDMNHLNAIAGTSSADTGIVGVSMQFFDWNPDGSPNIIRPSLGWARGGNGEPVDTLFNAWKRKWPGSKTIYASGKGWVAEMFRTKGSDVDILLTGYDHPSWIKAPHAIKFYDPPSDKNAKSDPESIAETLFCRMAYEKKPDRFPPDEWIARASLAVLENQKPDFGVILLAEMDDAQHGLGAIESPEEFRPAWHLIGGNVRESVYNPDVWKEPIIDAVREIDIQFGVLVDGIRKIPYYRDATIVLYSDHGHRTHRDTFRQHYDPRINTNPFDVLRDAGFLTKREKKGKDLFIYTATSFGMAHFRGKSVKERAARAKEARQALMAHRVRDRISGSDKSPWHILDRDEMVGGVPGVCGPGELYHAAFADNNTRGRTHWPELFFFMKDGWQLPITSRMVHNIGAELPWFLPTTYIFYGGHGAPDTADIVMAMQGPGITKGKVVSDPDGRLNHRISDIAATVASMFGIPLRHAPAGRDLTSEI